MTALAGVAEGRCYRIKLVLLLAIVTLVVVLPTMVAIGARHDSAPYRDIGDSAIEVEQDAAFLLHGTNYYARTFFDTPLAKWWPVGPPNPALYHADKLPGEVIVAALLSLPVQLILGWFDVRLLYLLALFVMIGVALHLPRGPTQRLALLAALALNPLFVGPMISGSDGVLVLAEVLVAVACARRGRPRAALLVLGLACATKYTAVLLVPFFLLWLAGRRSGSAAWGGQLSSAGRPGEVRGLIAWSLQALALIALPALVLIGPFLLWDARAYVDSTIGFIAGTVAHSFPIRGPEGYGFATFVLQGGLVRSAQDYYPFGLLQLCVALPLLWVLLRRQWRDNTLSRAMAGYATLFLVVSFFARFFHASHLAYGVALFALARFLGDERAAGAALPPSAEPVAPDAQGHVGLDLLVLLFLTPQVLAPPVGRSAQLTAAAALFLLVAYAVVAALADGPPRPSRLVTLSHPRLVDDGPARAEEMPRSALAGHPPPGPRRRGSSAQARASRLQTVLLLLLVGLLLIWPSLSGILARHHSQPYTYITDNAMQVEYATSFLLAGRNPYAATYTGTPMVHWYADPHMTQALYHADELPLNLVLTAPARLLAGATIGWFDERFLLLPLLGLTMLCLWLLGGAPEVRRARIAAVALGPFMAPAYVYGDTDVIVVAALAATLLALRGGQGRLSALLMGAAIAAKQTAIFLSPLYFAYLWGTAPPGSSWQEKARHVWRHGRLSLLVPALTVAPFLAWDAPAFWASTVSFVAGTIPHAYPIRGIGAYGFGAVVMVRRWVASDEAYFPFLPLQAACVVPLLVVLCRALARWPRLPLLVSAYAVVMGASYFFSRFLQDGGVGYILLVVALACLTCAPRPPAARLDAAHASTGGA